MNITQCMYCRKPFAALGGRICPACLDQIDRDFITVRDYIDEHRTANIKDIAEETEVSEKHIIHLIKEGRLILDNPGDGAGIIVCESCKKPIKTGKLCEDCMKSLASTMDKAVSGSKPEEPRQKQLTAEELKKLGKIR